MQNITVIFKISDHVILRPIPCDIVLDKRTFADTSDSRDIESIVLLKALRYLPDVRIFSSLIMLLAS